jgi:hypothetical protein
MNISQRFSKYSCRDEGMRRSIRPDEVSGSIASGRSLEGGARLHPFLQSSLKDETDPNALT